MQHVYSSDVYVASINKQDRNADNFRKEEPWLLLHKTGRVDRFTTAKEAKEEARKSWVRVTFKVS